MANRKSKIWKYVRWAFIVIVLGLLTKFLFFPKNNKELELVTEIVRNETITQEVSATGTITPLEIVDVGTQVSGIISKVLVDHNSKVKKGEVLALMDKRTLEYTFEEAKANLEKSSIILKQTKRDHTRALELYEGDAITKDQLEKAEDALSQAKASYDIAIIQSDRARVNLSYATIVSPIDGIVLDRNAEVGQTVAATFSTPNLFRIVNDLTKMKIEASVDEADIGMVSAGQNVYFFVDAYPLDTFYGEVREIYLQPEELQSVITYKVIVDIENEKLALKPGMTATLMIIVDQYENALSVQNSVFQFTWEEEIIDFMQNKKWQLDTTSYTQGSNAGNGATVYIKKGKTIEPKVVNILFQNEFASAIDGLNEGDTVVSKIYLESPSSGTNMFTSQARRSNDK